MARVGSVLRPLPPRFVVAAYYLIFTEHSPCPRVGVSPKTGLDFRPDLLFIVGRASSRFQRHGPENKKAGTFPFGEVRLSQRPLLVVATSRTPHGYRRYFRRRGGYPPRGPLRERTADARRRATCARSTASALFVPFATSACSSLGPKRAASQSGILNHPPSACQALFFGGFQITSNPNRSAGLWAREPAGVEPALGQFARAARRFRNPFVPASPR